MSKPKFTPETTSESKRKKLWQLDGSLYCAILGTCLTINDLMKLARQCRIPLEKDITDYDLHRLFVSSVGQNGPISRVTHKLLDKKYKTTITRLSKCRSSDALAEEWQQALQGGDIAGTFWALTSHPLIKSQLLDLVYGDVHMLSHLAGSSNRVEIQKFQQIKDELLESKTEQAQVIKAHREQLAGKECRIQALEQEVLKLLSRQSTPAETIIPDQSDLEKKLDQYSRHADWTEQKLAKTEMQLTQLAHKVKGLQELLEEAQADKEAAENALKITLEINNNNGTRPNGDLDGRQIAYVGGRTSLSPHFKTLVERFNGKFSFHDGGLEDSRASLTCTLNGADLVFCPIDCISHDACLRVKRFCKQNAKTFVPLRSSGLSAFTRGLQSALEEQFTEPFRQPVSQLN